MKDSVSDDCRLRLESVGLVDNLDGLGTQRILMAIPVVAAEEQIRPAWEHHANVGLGIASIATIGCGECGCCHRGVHG